MAPTMAPTMAQTTATSGGGGGGCFPSQAKVYLRNGKSITMSELKLGDEVQAGTDLN